MLNKKALDMQRLEVDWSLSGMHTLIFCGFDRYLLI